MLKKAAFALAMVSLLALAGQYFTYQQYQAQLKQQLAHLQQQSAWRFQLEQPSAKAELPLADVSKLQLEAMQWADAASNQNDAA